MQNKIIRLNNRKITSKATDATQFFPIQQISHTRKKKRYNKRQNMALDLLSVLYPQQKSRVDMTQRGQLKILRAESKRCSSVMGKVPCNCCFRKRFQFSQQIKNRAESLLKQKFTSPYQMYRQKGSKATELQYF